MNETELERAWPAAEPPPGFSDRVLEQLQRSPAPPASARRRAGWATCPRSLAAAAWPSLPRRHVLALAAVGLALGGLFLRAWLRPDGGDVFAAGPRVVSIGAHVVAELSSGAHLRWSGAPLQRDPAEVQQDQGAVTYRVVPGTRFRVQTPHGSVAALGTVFRVAVADPHEEGESMRKRWGIAGAGATLGALLFVSVEQGNVRLSGARREVLLAAGQSGSIGSDGVLRVDPEARAAATAPASPGAREPARLAGARSRTSPVEAERYRARVLDSLQVAERRPVAENGSAEGTPQEAPPGTMVDRTGELGEENLRVLNHELIPLVDGCQDQARERDPRLSGMLALDVKLAGAEAVGGIIETLEPAPDLNQIADAELIECVRQSAFSIQLPAPTKSGRSELQLTIPLDDPRPGDAGR